MATKPISETNFINACANQGVNPPTDKKQKAKETAVLNFVAYKKIEQQKQEQQANYKPLFHQLKNEYPPKGYGHGYRCVNREID